MNQKSFNDSHPERREGEVFVGNMKIDLQSPTAQFVDWNSLRVGEVAYDSQGGEIDGWRPIFRSA